MFNNLVRQLIYPTDGLRLNLVIMSVISLTIVNFNFRYGWNASLLIFDWLFPTLPLIQTKYLLNSSAIIL